MYSQHFGLTQDPFSIAPDPRYLFMSERHREALAHLLFGVASSVRGARGTGGGFVLLTGDIGTGKTTICRCFLEQIPVDCHVAYIFNPKLSVSELLQSICEEFGVKVSTSSPSVKDHIDALNAFLLHSHAAGGTSVLIIDEAQNLAPDVLEQLRLLTNLETHERKLLQIVLIGQPELRAMLERPELEQLAQRVIARFHLDALTQDEATLYIQHRLAVAGHQGPLPFERQALRRIHRLARGVPRRINLLCARALLGAWTRGLHRVDHKVVQQAATEVFGAPRARVGGRTLALLAALLGGAACAALAWSLMARAPASLQSSTPVPPASAPARAASAVEPLAPLPLAVTAPVVAVPMPIALADIDTLLEQLPRDIDTAWRGLAPNWKIPASEADPCVAAAARQLRCYRTGNLSVPMLRQLNRPGILTLQLGNGLPVYAVLVGLSEQSATLRLGTRLQAVRLSELGRLWHGDFATYWQAPEGYSADLRTGATGAAVEHLASQLSQLEGKPLANGAAPVLDAALRERVRAFQRGQGLNPDGQPGPMTYMQLDSILDPNEPRLQTEAR